MKDKKEEQTMKNIFRTIGFGKDPPYEISRFCGRFAKAEIYGFGARRRERRGERLPQW